ncbi:TonB-dependent receptor [Mangrovimicrobium sediminis]|uniref:TonB-dependent receptor n=1 Tax=Mangrovimicrobium sediminis TaxID=2562682 RepID=A0A4Z0LXU9_9GAMM|nr:TonB-dependent receptor [Haliea sp. SAOS-164]TGD72070.1 TonB-dependent receptor [Haliea sp. SAOS-164]
MHPPSSPRALRAGLLAAFAVTAADTSLAQDTARPYNLQLEEVTVTAQKREQDFMSVPVAVDAFTVQDIINTGAVGIQDIDAFMPGVDVSAPEGTSTQVSITVRGVSAINISSGQDPSVATFYDGAYMPRAVTSIPFTDIQRIEVLKGPQGTLFGRNATAGVVNIVPNKPEPEFNGFLKARLGNQDLQRYEGMLNLPLGDDLAMRGNLFYHQRDGFTRNVDGGDDFRDEGFLAGRAAVLWTPGESTSIQLAADFEDRNEMPRAAIGVGKYAYQGSDDPFRGKDRHDVVGGEEETRDMYGVSAQLEQNLGGAWNLFGVLSYRDWETTNLEEEDGTADPRRYLDTNNIEDSDIFYTEWRVSYDEGPFNFIAGANYSREDVYQRTDIGLLTDSYMQFVSLLLLPEIGIEPDQDTHAWDLFADSPDAFWNSVSDLAGIAVLPPEYAGQYFTETMDNTGDFVNWGIFADLRYQLTERLGITGGLRYSDDQKDYSWQTFPVDLGWSLPPARVQYDPAALDVAPSAYFDKYSASDSWSRVTGRLVLDWQLADNALTYLSYATGYKSGGFDGQSFGAVRSGSFDPEDMTSIELGLKGDFFDDRLRAELAVFHQELDDRQQQVDLKESADDPVAAPGVISSDDTTDGLELSVTWSVIDNLRLAALTTLRETETEREAYFNAAGEPAGGDKESSSTDTNYTLVLDWTPQVPRGFLLVHVSYEFDEDPGPDSDTPIFQTGSWYFQDREWLNARIAWSNDAETIEVALWGDNLLDEEYADNPSGLGADTLGGIHTNPYDTLTYGIDLRYSF